MSPTTCAHTGTECLQRLRKTQQMVKRSSLKKLVFSYSLKLRLSKYHVRRYLFTTCKVF